MAFDINNFVIDHVIRGMMFSTADGSYMWSINQITDPSLSITSETADAVDALGSVIASFNRGKAAEFSASNSLFDLGLFAAQQGVTKTVASETAKIVVPAFETLTIASGETTKVLKHTPVEVNAEGKPVLKALYQLKGDGTLGTKYEVGTSASATKFVFDGDTNTITLPTGLAVGTELLAMYDYENASAVSVSGDAINFPKAGRFVMEILGTDTCDPTTLIHAFLEFPNAKLDAAVDVSFTTDGNHPFTIKANQNYCDSKKLLFNLIIPEEA